MSAPLIRDPDCEVGVALKLLLRSEISENKARVELITVVVDAPP